MRGVRRRFRTWLQRQLARLRGQALVHLLLVALIAVWAVVALGAVAFYLIEGREISQSRDSSRAFYEDQLLRAEAVWRTNAEQVKGRIEFSRILETRDAATGPKLSAFLNAQWAFTDFPTMLILAADGNALYRYGPVGQAINAADVADAEWFMVPSHEEIYRVFKLPIWLGAAGQGSLLLFRPINGEALRQLVIPGVHLELYVDRRELLHSHQELRVPEVPMRNDTVEKAGKRFVEVELDWPGKAVQATFKPQLKVYRAVGGQDLGLMFGIFSAVSVSLMTLLLWLGLWRWLSGTVQRIEAIDGVLDEHAASNFTAAEIARRLAPMQQKDDEIAALAAAFEVFATTVERREDEAKIYLETLSVLDEAVLDLDLDGRIIHASSGWHLLSHLDDSIGTMLATFVHAEDIGTLRLQCDLLRSGRKDLSSMRLRLAGEVGLEQWVEARLINHRDASGQVISIRGVIRDITQTYQHERQITHMALHDALTGLPNRVLLEDRFKVALRMAQRNGHHAAACFLDLDNFKTVNDSLGHKAGDALLVGFADLLRSALRSGDTLARWGGDEFVLLLPDMESLDAVRGVTRKIADMMQAPLKVDGTDIRVTFSMGAAVYPDDGEDMGQLFSQADRAMFYAKAQGRNQVCFFSDMADKGLGKKDLYIQNHLANAINNLEIQAWYQPLIDARSGLCIGAEVLARWKDAELGWISPATFIPMAENIGLIRELGNQVWRAALATLRSWHDAGRTELRIAVNISKRQLFSASLVECMVEDVARLDLRPQHIVLEVTESVALRDAAHAASRLKELRDAGFVLAIDDFGTGYSSFSQLHEIPVDELKIDISFVRRLREPKGLPMVESIAQIARILGLKSVAEGVEDGETAEILRTLGVDILQGYHFGKPMPAEDFSAWLAAQPSG